MPSWAATTCETGVREARGEHARREVRQPSDLHVPVSSAGDRFERARQVLRGLVSDRVELEGDLVGVHPRTIGHRGP